ncbi:MAG: hypothetical protein KA715_09070 [Xanthomonadaceae bacterium]|nr:hypothetical protein [Xanthomonadaceae bacterium]
MQFFRNKFKDVAKISLKNPKTTVLVGTSYTIDIAGGTKPFTYKLISGGGSLTSSGVYKAPASITTPDADGTEHIVIMVTDSKGKTATITLYVMDAFVINDNDVDLLPGDTFSFSAMGGRAPYTFSILSGLGSVDPVTGLFTSTGAQGVTFVKVTDADGNTDQAMINVFWVLDPTAININIPVNTTYTITPATGKPAFNFAITAGIGVVSPATGTNSTFTAPAVPGLTDVTVTDALAATKVYTFNVYQPLTYVPTTKNVQVSSGFPFGVSGGIPPYSHIVQSGAASGSIIAGTGAFTATATPGTVVIRVTDSIANTAIATINVYSPLTISPTSFSLMTSTTQSFSGGGGVPPYVYSVFAGGGSIDAAGLYTAPGVPGAATVRVTDAELNTANASVTITGLLYVPPLVVLAPTNTYNIAPTGGQSPYAFAFTAGAAGGTLDTPGPAVSSLFTAALPTGTRDVTVSDSSTPTAQTAVIQLQVNAALGMSCSPLTITTANTSTCTASNGVPGYTYSVVGGAPNGTVTIDGVYTPPATPGTYSVRVTDSYGNIVNVPITVNAAIAIAPASATIQVAQNQVVTVSGGVSPFVFSKQSGPGDTSVTTLTATTARGDAGMTPGTLVIRVTDALGNWVDSTIGIGTPPEISGAPSTRNIHMSQTNTITPSGGAPSVNGSLNYSYSIVAGGGSLSLASGASTVYTAPAGVGSATVRISDGVVTAYDIVYTIIPNLSISPTSITLMVNNPTTFTASNVVGTAAFSVVSAGGGSIVGATGAYTAPAAVPGSNPATIRVTDSGPQQADATVDIKPQLTASPAAFNLLVTQTQVITLAGGLEPYTFAFVGTSGSIAPQGLQGMGVTSTTYTAGVSSGSGTFTVTDAIGNFVNVAISVGNVPPPTGFTVTGATPTTINTSWNVVASATGYKVRADGGGWTDVGNVLTYNFTALASGSLHTLEVLAYNAGGDGGPVSLNQRICAVDFRLNAGACTACNIGEFSAGGIVASCTACTNAAGNYVYTGLGGGIDNCAYACNAGYGSSSCTACSTGVYDSVGDGQEACANCSASTYASAGVNTSCTNCDIGTWSAAAAGSCGACTNNTTGFYWTSNGTSAVTCTNTACTNGAGTFTYTTHGGTTNTCTYACNAGYGSAACTQCTAGMYDSVGAGQEDCINCPATTYSAAAGATSCASCPTGTWAAAGSSTCGACTNTTVGNYWTGNGATAGGCADTACTNKLGTSTYDGHGGTTNTCSYYCNDGYGSASCTACGGGTYDSVGAGIEACNNCGPGNSTSGSATATACTACGTGTFSSGVANLNCSACTATPTNGTTLTYSVSSGLTTDSCPIESVSCNSGHRVSGITCLQCGVDNWYGGGTATSCNFCGNGNYTVSATASAAVQCLSCTNTIAGASSVTYTSSGGGSETGCTIGSGSYSCNGGYGYGGAAQSCTACTAGNASAGDTNTCATCVQGYSAATASSCTSCANPVLGTAGAGATSLVYTDGNTTSTCNFTSFSCPANSTWNSSLVGGIAACNCDAFYSWDGLACAPTACPAGFYGAGCTECASGYGGGGCTQCTAGTYDSTPNSGNDTCTSASAGNYVAGVGASSQTQCAAGTYQGSTGQPSCTPASAGHYASGLGNTSQTQCAAGTYQGSTGQSDCTPASEGYYASGTGNTTQTICAPGSYQGSTGQSDCTPASAAFYAAGSGNTAQTACPVGSYSTGGASTCSTCTNTTVGNYWNSNATTEGGCGLTACTGKLGISSFITHGGTTDSCAYACDNGYGTSSCTQCGADTRDGTAGGQEACVACSAGEFSLAGSTSCTTCTNLPTNCASAVYSTTGGGSNSCNFTSITPNGGYTWNGNTTAGGAACNLADCAAGTGWNGSACVTCAEGTYDATPGTGLDACTSASAGYFVSGTGATSETACAVGTYSTGGASSCSACTNTTNGEYFTSNATTAGGCGVASCTNTTATGSYWNGHGGTNPDGCSTTGCTNKLGTSSYIGNGGASNSCPYECDAGNGGADCTICPAGWFDATPGGTEACEPCNPGTYNTSAGNDFCNDAWPGAYCPGSGNTTVTNCPNGTYSSIMGASSCLSCTNTTPGRYWTSLAESDPTCEDSACTNAPANADYTGHGGTSDSCSWVCSAGYFWNDEDCLPMITTTTTTISGGGCFTAETEITMADGSKKAIKDIVKGEKVLSAEGNAQAVAETFVHSDNKFLFAINEGKHFITEGHPIKTKDGWKSISPKKSMEENHKISGDVGQLKVGDVILADSGEIEVTKIHKKSSNVKVYNLEVENDHSYRANGIFVHNKVILPCDCSTWGWAGGTCISDGCGPSIPSSQFCDGCHLTWECGACQ